MSTTHQQKPSLSPLESDLVGYFESNPGAADSAEGVRRWWLHKQLAVRSEALVARALEELVAKGVLTKRESDYAEPIYSLSKQ